MVFSPRLGERVRAWGSSLMMTGREVLAETVQRWGWLYLGKFQQLLRGMSGARLRRVGHEANIPRCQVDDGVDHDLKKNRYNECRGELFGDYV